MWTVSIVIVAWQLLINNCSILFRISDMFEIFSSILSCNFQIHTLKWNYHNYLWSLPKISVGILCISMPKLQNLYRHYGMVSQSWCCLRFRLLSSAYLAHFHIDTIITGFQPHSTSFQLIKKEYFVSWPFIMHHVYRLQSQGNILTFKS